jgi:hypothetical protein
MSLSQREASQLFQSRKKRQKTKLRKVIISAEALYSKLELQSIKAVCHNKQIRASSVKEMEVHPIECPQREEKALHLPNSSKSKTQIPYKTMYSANIIMPPISFHPTQTLLKLESIMKSKAKLLSTKKSKLTTRVDIYERAGAIESNLIIFNFEGVLGDVMYINFSNKLPQKTLYLRKGTILIRCDSRIIRIS